MGTKSYTFTGPCKWAKLVSPDEKYNKYGLDMYLDEENMKVFEASGMQLKVKEDEDGKFVSFRRPVKTLFKDEVKEWGVPKVTMADGSELEELVGNGSNVTVEVDVYDTVKGPGHRLNTVVVNELVVYKRPSDTDGPDYIL